MLKVLFSERGWTRYVIWVGDVGGGFEVANVPPWSPRGTCGPWITQIKILLPIKRRNSIRNSSGKLRVGSCYEILSGMYTGTYQNNR
jgi:hypothetical protein